MMIEATDKLDGNALATLMAAAAEGAGPEAMASDHPALALAAMHGFCATTLLGSGGMSEVWRGIDENTGRDVAIKIAKPGVDPALIAREAAALGRFHDAGIVSLIRQGGDGESRYLILEYVEGQSLVEAISDPEFTAEDVNKAVLAILTIVQRIHAAGFCHNDLSPANIIRRSDGSWVLLDFALASQRGYCLPSKSSIRGGTEAFLAPELKRGEGGTTSVASDLYSVGRMLQWCYAQVDHLAGKAVHLVLDKATAESAGGRFASASEFREALDSAVHAATPTNRPPRTHMLIAAVVLFMVTVGGGTWLNLTNSRNTNPGPASLASRGAELGSLSQIADQLAAGQMVLAREALDRVALLDRGWEWRHLWTQATEPPALIQVEYSVPTTACHVDANTGDLLLATPDGRLLRQAFDRTLHEFAEGLGLVTHLDVTSDGHVLVTDMEGTLTLYDPTEDAVTKRRLDLAGLSVGWFLDTGSVVCWSSGSRRLYRITNRDEPPESLGSYAMVLPAGSSNGWSLRYSDGFGQATWFDPRLVSQGNLDLGDAIPLAFDAAADTDAIMIGTSHGSVWIRAKAADQPRRIELSDVPISAVALATDQNRAFAASDRLYVLDLSTSEILLTLPIDAAGVIRHIDWHQLSQTLTLTTNLGYQQWRSSPEPALASR
jgi:hypothetical protein